MSSDEQKKAGAANLVKARAAKKTKLPLREEMLVRGLFEGKSGAQALIDARYNPKNRDNAAVMASQIIKRERVQNRIAEILDSIYPDGDADVGATIRMVLKAPVKGSPDDDGTQLAVTLAEKKAYIDLFMRLRPSQTTTTQELKEQVSFPSYEDDSSSS